MENATLNSDNTSRTLIRLEQTGKHGWRARGWSAFLTCMLLPNLICDRLNSYHLEEEEIVILLSNLLDNAIRESEKVLKNTGKAVIHLKLECEDHKLIFAIRNPVTEKVEIENDTIKSKRGDHYGIGLLNVKAVVDKYGGDMVLSCDENEFKAVVIL